MKGFLVSGLAAGLLLGGASLTLAATVTTVIDNFSDVVPNVPNQDLLRLLVNSANPNASALETSLTGVLGNSRLSQLTYTTPTNVIGSAILAINTSSGGIAAVTNDIVGGGANSTSVITWNRAGAGLGANFSTLTGSNAGFFLEFPDPIPTNVSITLQAQRNVGSGPVSSRTFNAVTGTVGIPFSTFSDPTFFNSPFGSLSMTINGNTAYRVAISQIYVQGNDLGSIPEPSFLMGFLALATLGIGTRLTRKK
jgi:hypothetical protein